ncbi:MAG: TIM barrel protein [Pirellulales bacterium]|nr:TIM barrel protein [Pirellulales bacterium]
MPTGRNCGDSTDLSRRHWIQGTAAALAAAAWGAKSAGAEQSDPAQTEKVVVKGRIKQAVPAGYGGFRTWQELGRHAAAMGLKGLDFLGPEDFAEAKKLGLICTLTPSHGLTEGLVNKKNHAECIAALTKSIEATGDAGFPNVVDLSGNRYGTPDDVGLKNYVEGIKKVIGLAEKKKVNICLEVLNSRHDHPDYMCDTVEWGVEACKNVGSPRLKVLFDIYHIQIMQGDIIDRIRKFKEYIGHYHTAGVPGRHEIGDDQELNYPAIMRAIVETGFDGYVSHEFGPTRDPLTSLREAVKICDV